VFFNYCIPSNELGLAFVTKKQQAALSLVVVVQGCPNNNFGKNKFRFIENKLVLENFLLFVALFS
jgi:hypothetical protein